MSFQTMWARAKPMTYCKKTVVIAKKLKRKKDCQNLGSSVKSLMQFLIPTKSNSGLKLFQPDKLKRTVKMIGKIKIPIKTINPGSKKKNLCLKFI